MLIRRLLKRYSGAPRPLFTIQPVLRDRQAGGQPHKAACCDEYRLRVGRGESACAAMIAALRPICIRSVRGPAWLSIEGSLRDFVLVPGQMFRLESGLMACVSGLPSSEILVHDWDRRPDALPAHRGGHPLAMFRRSIAEMTETDEIRRR
jgi:hypothetical protein